jgi:AraC family transcriptional regulator of adaptative response/methylated-DNA-[protein]-cysteine methyltransferase
LEDLVMIRYTIVPCSLGRLLVAGTERGVCAVSLADDERGLLKFLTAEFPGRQVEQDATGLHEWASAIAQLLKGTLPKQGVPTDVEGTAFQRRVWRALGKIPLGQTRSYSAIAESLGQPDSARAVARACATNPIAVIVPCHRVIRADGGISGYRWGVARKQAILASERKQAQKSVQARR